MPKRKFAIIGLGRFGFKLLSELAKRGSEVMVFDQDQEKIEKAKDLAAEALVLDCTDKEALEKSGIKEADTVVIAVGKSVESSILTLTALKELGVKEIIARAINPLHARVLKNLGADRVVFPEEDIAVRVAHFILFQGVKDYLELKGPWHLAEIEIGPKSVFNGKTIKEIHPRSKYNISILMVEREIKKFKNGEVEEEIVRKKEFPREDYIVQEKDILLVFGEPENIEKFEKVCCV